MQTTGGDFSVTSGLGRVEIYANNCKRFLGDIPIGQGGTGCNQLSKFSV